MVFPLFWKFVMIIIMIIINYYHHDDNTKLFDKIHYFDSNLFKTVGTPWNAMLMVLPQMMFSSLIHCQATILLFCFPLKIFVSPWILVWGLHQFWQYFKEPFTYASDCHLVAQTLYQWGACPTLFHHFFGPIAKVLALTRRLWHLWRWQELQPRIQELSICALSEH